MYLFLDCGIIYVLKGKNILKFNLKDLEVLSGGSDVKLIWLLYKWMRDGNTIPRKGDKFLLKKPLFGNSFLLNPEPLFDKTLDTVYVAQYIKLAGRRDILLYEQYGLTSLLLSFYIDINTENIKYNPLINITEKEITFKFEK